MRRELYPQNRDSLSSVTEGLSDAPALGSVNVFLKVDPTLPGGPGPIPNFSNVERLSLLLPLQTETEKKELFSDEESRMRMSNGIKLASRGVSISHSKRRSQRMNRVQFEGLAEVGGDPS